MRGFSVSLRLRADGGAGEERRMGLEFGTAVPGDAPESLECPLRLRAPDCASRAAAWGGILRGWGLRGGLAVALLVLVGAGGGPAAVQAAELVSNIDQGNTENLTSRSSPIAQRFTTGSNANGYRLIDIGIWTSTSATFNASVYTVDSANFPDAEVTALTRPGSFGASVKVFTAPEHSYLKPNTTYTVRLSGSGYRPGTTTNDGEDSGAATGFSIANEYDYFESSIWRKTGSGKSLRIAINGEVAVNTPATGSIAISGTARVGGTLTATTNDLVDLNGLPENATDYSYQWVRIDGTTETQISGATGNSYTLVAADSGKRVQVRVSFTDGLGFSETIESAEIAVRAMMPPATCPAYSTPTGQMQVWNGTVTVAALTFGSVTFAHGYNLDSGNGSLSDPKSFDLGTSYTVDGVGVVASGRTDAGSLSFSLDSRLTSSEVRNLRLHVCGETYAFADAVYVSADQSYNWRRAGLDWSSLVGSTRVLNLTTRANAAATGAPVISGTARVGETLTALTHAIRDGDGLTGVSYSYQWFRQNMDGTGAEEITTLGPEHRTYTLTADDQGKVIRMHVRFTDDQGNTETRGSAVFPSSGTIVMPAPPPPLGGVWSATLTVKSVQGSFGCLDFNASTMCSNTDVLTDDDFTVDLTDYTVTSIALNSSGRLELQFDKSLPDRASRWKLEVTKSGATTTLNFGDDTDIAGDIVTWTSTGLSWAADDTVTVAIDDDADVTPPAFHELESLRPQVSVPGELIRIFFDGTLDQANRPPIGAFSMMADGSAVTLSNLIGANNALEISLSPVIREGQTVTLSYTDPTDGDDANAIQDADGNDMASFTVEVWNRSNVTGTPGAPTGLEATENGSTRIDLAWTAPSDEGHSAITGYRVEWSADGSAPWADVIADTGSTNTAYSNTGLTGGTTRHYRVSAITSIGTGSPSNVDSATTGMGAPGKPTALTLTVMGGTQIDLAWTAPTDIGDSAITGYRIEWSPDGTDGSWSDLVADTDSTATAYSNTGLSSETTRHYRVSAINDDGAGSPSDSVSATTDDIEGPVVVSATGLTGGDIITIAFDEDLDRTSAQNVPTNAFTVTADGAVVGFNQVAIISRAEELNLSGLSPTIKRGQTVVVTYTDPTSGDDATALQDHDGNDAKSFTTGQDGVPAVTNDSNQAPVAPGKTLMPAAEAGGEDWIAVTWKPPAYNGGAAITGYRIEVSTDGSTFAPLVPNHEVIVDGKILTAYRHTGLSAGDTRHYRISAINSAGTGPVSDTVNATTSMGAPGKPTGLALTVRGGTQIDLAWTAPADIGDSAITGYRIEWSPDGTDGSWSDLVADTGSTATAYSNTGLSSETTRHYRVSAINDDGVGNSSDSVSATTDDIEGPVVVSANVPAHGLLIELAFDEVPAGGAAERPEAGRFEVTVDGDALIFAQVSIVAADKAIVLSSLARSIKQDQSVVVTYTDPTSGDDTAAIQDDDGNDAKSFTTGEGDVPAVTNNSTVAPVAPGKPLMPEAKAGGEDRIVLTWEPPADSGGTAITGYRIEVSTDGNAFTDLVANHNETVSGKIVTRYVHTGLMAEDIRHYRVSAINSAGTGPASDTVNANTVPRGTVELSVASASVAEGGAVVWTVTATTPDDVRPETGFEMEVRVSTADGPSPDGAKAGPDYTALDRTVTFRRADFSQAGSSDPWIATKTGTVVVSEDVEVEAEENFVLNAAIVTADAAFTVETGPVEVAIPNTDTWGIAVTAAPAEIVEGLTREVVLTARLTPAGQGCVADFPFTLRLGVAGTATDPDDYTLDAAPADRTVAACAAEAVWRVTLAAKRETVDDANETVTFTPQIVGAVEIAPDAARLEQATVTIRQGRGVAVGPLALRFLEGGRNTYTVALTSQPTGTVTVTPAVSGDSDVRVSPASLSFTADTWHVAQTVTVRAGEDTDETDDEAEVRHTVTGADYGANGVTAATVQVRVQDNDGSFGTVTAAFDEYPDPLVHFGEAFRVTLNFSHRVRGERPEMIGRGVRVSGGAARYLEPSFYRPQQIQLEVTPSGTGDVEVSAVALPCDMAGSICTSGGNGLAGREKLTIRGVGSAPGRPANVQGLRTDDGFVVLFWDLNDDATAYTLRWRPRGGEWREESGRPPGPNVQIHRFGPTRLAPAELPAEAFGPLERGRSYDVELRWENPRGSGSWRDVSDAVRNLTPPRPQSLTLTQRGPYAVALNWRSQSAAGALLTARHQVRLARYPQSLPGGVDLHYPNIRVFRDDGWVDIPDSGNNGANFTSAVLSGAFRGQPLLHVWELRAQVRAVSAAGAVSEASEVAFVPDTAPGFAGFELLSHPTNGESWSAGDIIAVALAVNEPVTVTGGAPALTLRIGGENREAAFTRLYHPDWAYEGGWVGRSGTRMRFEYTVVADDVTGDAAGGIEIPAGEVRLNGATVLDGTLLPGAGVGRKSAVLNWASTVLAVSASTAHTLSIADAETTEGTDASLTFTVTLAPAASDEVTVDYATADGTATEGDDYTATSGTLTFAPGETTKTVAVPIIDDNEEDDGETLTLTLSNAVGAELSDAEATGTIRNMEEAVDSTTTLSIADAEATEGTDASFAFTVTLEPAAADEVTVDWATADGPSPNGAVAGSDYTAGSGTLTFAAGETGKTVTVAVLDDSADEISETVTVTLSNASGAGIEDGEATGTLADNDGPTPLTATFTDAPAAHTGSGVISLRISLDAALSTSWKGVQHSLAIANGTLTRTHRIDGRSDLWGIAVEPDGDDDVTVTLNPSVDCADPEKIMCTSGGRRIETVVSTVIPGPASEEEEEEEETVEPVVPLTASFSNMPSEHNGSGTFTFTLTFSENVEGLSYKTLKGSAFQVTGGRVSNASRRTQGSNQSWTITVEPTSYDTLSIALPATTDCTATGAVCTSGGKALSNTSTVSVIGPPGLSVADARVREAEDATVDFVVTLSRAGTETVTVDYATSDGTATAGSDYTAASGTLSFAPGELTRTVSVAVLEDSHDEAEETFTLTLSNASGNHAWLSDATATGTIENDDPMPQAWMARFGRTVADQVIDAVDGRFSASRTAGVEMTLAGERIGWTGGTDAEPGAAEAHGNLEAMAQWLQSAETGDDGGTARVNYRSRAVTSLDLLTGSSFALTGESASGGMMSLWGRGAVSQFDGREGDLSLDGEVSSVMLGADWAQERWTAGLLVSRSEGEGGYLNPEAESGSVSAMGGKIESTLTGLFPYGRYAASDRLTLWGIAGYGTGELTLTPEDQTAMRTDTDLMMGAVGLHRVTVEAPADGGIELAVKTDALAVRTSSDAVSGGAGGNLAATEADVTRLRLGLEGTWRELTVGAGTLSPVGEIGLRHDGGDAETGFGIDLGVGFSWSDPESGITAELRGRGLLTHESEGFRDRGISGSFAWDPGQGSGRGPKVTLTRTMGASATGGVDALLGHRHLGGLAANDPGSESGAGSDDLANRRLELRMGYGYSVLEGRFTMTPEFGMGISNGHRDYTLGWRLVRGGSSGGGSFEISFEARRSESANDDTQPVHEVGFRFTARF